MYSALGLPNTGTSADQGIARYTWVGQRAGENPIGSPGAEETAVGLEDMWNVLCYRRVLQEDNTLYSVLGCIGHVEVLFSTTCFWRTRVLF